MITTVSSAAALNAALSSAHSGDTIQLAAGSYAGITATNLQFATGVTITSADPLHEAVITSLSVTSSSGLTFSNLEFDASTTTADNPFKITSGQNIKLDHLNVHGTMDGNAQDDFAAFLIRSSSNVSVTNSEFQQLRDAIGELDNDHLTISHNTFHDLQVDGVRGGGSSFVTISGNSFRDFFPKDGDHGDAIQFWTTNTTASAHDITITDNIFQRGAGGIAQGIFLRDQVGNIPYIHVTIANNFIVGGMYNGIFIDGGNDVTIDHNTVVGFTDMKSWIRLDHVSGGTLTNNTAYAFLTSDADYNLTMSNNVTTPLVSDGGAAAVAQWDALHQDGLSLVGTSGADSLTGGLLSDTLNGGAGSDLLTGGSGDDLYITDGKAKVVELVGGGTDTVQSSGTITLTANVENLVLVGLKAANGTGNGSNNQITGNDAANSISGLNGSDTLVGGGGADTITGGHNDDQLTGGAGADVFVFGQGFDHDVVTDFGLNGEHDVLDLSALYALNLHPTLSQVASGVMLTFTSGDTILLQGQHLANLHATATGYTI